MTTSDDFQKLILKEVTPIKIDCKDLVGRGNYGRVYAVKYRGTICAAKEIHSILLEGVSRAQMLRTGESFMRHCRQLNELRHPNVIQFFGVYYPTEAGGLQAGGKLLPVMVMEMMADSLTSLVDKHKKIPVHITCKYSIVHDVSLGLCYLHNHDPPIVHRDLSPNDILLTAHHVAKISDLGVAKVIKADTRRSMAQASGSVDFMAPESLTDNPECGLPMDMFSFAGIILHTFNQQWPSPTDQVQFDPKTRKMVALSELERRQRYVDKLRGEAEALRPLVEECLDNDPTVRPAIAAVCERIQAVKKDAYIESRDIITLYQRVEQLQRENYQKDKIINGMLNKTQSENSELKPESAKLKQELVSCSEVKQFVWF